MSLDPLDEKIIRILTRDGRRSFAAVGAEVGLSAPAVKRRVDRLVAAGAVTGFTAVVDPAALGWSTEAYVELYCSGQPRPSLLAKDLERLPEVVSACTVTGNADALLRIRAAGVRHFEQVLQRLTELEYVTHTKTTLVLSPLFERTRADASRAE
ncbi:Lrp/AsnC family transcriptional regulator [Marinitenerispora sediminis]|uniref:AsnC family transcriptional regulator n=1 Tax=Marinitenerispora sediminis TaxID=1931232 RepID=A0A368TAM0_9ACTN|nr:Lrp/AsnC family transcriptional regulator [Marinitenerispora sediminis]RCV52962.1 AsnC family transcriptional regulator [Marinitenerispora sediminis]RCV58441.1 AsnC family transcriptional regulator [Marinitenerispora sediminis]RCV61779.1 AsnC family transcriptional regulator [Marinitenerispora sediminis]